LSPPQKVRVQARGVRAVKNTRKRSVPGPVRVQCAANKVPVISAVAITQERNSGKYVVEASLAERAVPRRRATRRERPAMYSPGNMAGRCRGCHHTLRRKGTGQVPA